MQPKKRQLMIGAGAAAVSTLLPAMRAGAAEGTPKRTLVAAYYGGWSNPIDPSQRFVHGDNPWDVYPKLPLYGNVTHRMGGKSDDGKPLFKDRYPKGSTWPEGYDEKQQQYMDTAIVDASNYGIDVFAMNWYNDAFSNYPVENFKTSPNKNLMHWFLQWSNNSNSSKTPPTDSRQYFFESILRAAKHMDDSSYWTLHGKPVFAIYDVRQIDRIIQATLKEMTLAPMSTADTPDGYKDRLSKHEAFLQDCHNVVANYRAPVRFGDEVTGGIEGTGNAATVYNPMTKKSELCVEKPVKDYVPSTKDYVQSMHLLVATGDIGSWGRCTTVNGMYAYNIRSSLQQVLADSFKTMAEIAKAQYARYVPAVKSYRPPGGQQTWWPTLMAGFNDSPWVLSEKPTQDCMPTPEQFKEHCNDVRDVLDADQDATGGVAFIYAWNEYGEGGWIAPTLKADGTNPEDVSYERLDTVKRYLKGDEKYIKSTL